MLPTNLTREFYDRSPYPPVQPAGKRRSRLPPLDWLFSIDRADHRRPRRVLVAGCGTGAEAFTLRAALPDAVMVAVDFSAASIRLARQTQAAQSVGKRIRFIQADLTQSDLPVIVGGTFDLIACHGVLSYIPDPGRALSHLAQCLRPDGLLYLGVNGATHFSAYLRPVLARLGIDPSVLPGDKRWRRVLQMWEGQDGGATAGRLTRMADWYMGGDCFGPVLHNLPLHEWTSLGLASGLHLRASFGTHRALRPLIASDATSLFMPASRAAVGEMLDQLHPTGFHRLILTREPTPQPPWGDLAALRAWCPAPTGIYRVSARRARKAAVGDPLTLLKCSALDTQFEWPLPRWAHQILLNCDGVKSLDQLLTEQGQSALEESFVENCYLLHQCAVWNFLPPS